LLVNSKASRARQSVKRFLDLITSEALTVTASDPQGFGGLEADSADATGRQQLSNVFVAQAPSPRPL